MNEGSLPLPDRDDELNSCIERFEAMLHRNDHYFFDVEEFEIIIEHYLEQNDLRKAREVLTYAHQQHPGSMDLKFCEAHVLISMGKLNRDLDDLYPIVNMEPNNEDVHWNWPKRARTTTTWTSPSNTRTSKPSTRPSNA